MLTGLIPIEYKIDAYTDAPDVISSMKTIARINIGLSMRDMLMEIVKCCREIVVRSGCIEDVTSDNSTIVHVKQELLVYVLYYTECEVNEYTRIYDIKKPHEFAKVRVGESKVFSQERFLFGNDLYYLWRRVE